MDRIEMSNEFDLLYNNITSNLAPGLNEWEKSVFLTKALNEIVKNYFLARNNPKEAGFDDNPKRQLDFSKLINTKNIGPDTSYNQGIIDPRALVFQIPKDDKVMFIINESLLFFKEEGGDIVGIRQVIPLKYIEYTLLMSKPFKEPLKNQAWRLITDNSSSNATVDIIITSLDKKRYITERDEEGVRYCIRFVKRPQPIILTDLRDTFGEDLEIDGRQEATNCELDPAIHEEIVQRAVELAKIAWAGSSEEIQALLTSGQRSE